MCLIFSVRLSQIAQHPGAPNRTTAPSNLACGYNICKCKVTGLRHSLKSMSTNFREKTKNYYIASHIKLLEKEVCFTVLSLITYSFTEVYAVKQIITSRQAVRHEYGKIYSKVKVKVQFVEVVVTWNMVLNLRVHNFSNYSLAAMK